MVGASCDALFQTTNHCFTLSFRKWSVLFFFFFFSVSAVAQAVIQSVVDSFCDLLHEANEKEFTLLEERWLSEECIQAVMAFMQRKSKL